MLSGATSAFRSASAGPEAALALGFESPWPAGAIGSSPRAAPWSPDTPHRRPATPGLGDDLQHLLPQIAAGGQEDPADQRPPWHGAGEGRAQGPTSRSPPAGAVPAASPSERSSPMARHEVHRPERSAVPKPMEPGVSGVLVCLVGLILRPSYQALWLESLPQPPDLGCAAARRQRGNLSLPFAATYDPRTRQSRP